MIGARRLVVTTVVAVIAVTAGVVARVSVAEPAPDPWRARLEALDPADPLAYFELAEEIADTAETDRERETARTLFGLAGVLDPERLGRSACLALADLSPQEVERRRLLALAGLLGQGNLLTASAPPLDRVGAAPVATESALALIEALSHYRRGQGAKALASLDEEGAMELLRRHSAFLPGGAERLLEDCRHYRGQLRPRLSDRDLVRLLRLEVALLAGSEQPWSSALLLDRGRPLIEVDPDHVMETLGVNASRPFFRGGRWVDERAESERWSQDPD